MGLPSISGYHLTNVVLHVIVVVLLYSVDTTGNEDSGAGVPSRGPAFIAAAGFAVHPLQTESVGYVSGRSEVMCAVFFLSALLLSRRAIVAQSESSAALGIACGILALLSKETAIVLPVVFSCLRLASSTRCG